MVRKYPSLVLLTAVVVFIALADYTRLPAWGFFLLSLMALIGGFYAMTSRSFISATVLLALTVGLFSAFHYAIRHYDIGPHHVANITNTAERYQVVGEVADWPRLRPDRTEVVVEIDSLARAHTFRTAHGRIMLRISSPTTSIQRGDRLAFFGTIYPVDERENPGGFDYGRYLRLDRIFGVVYLPTELNIRVDRRSRFGPVAVVDHIRDAIRESFQDNLSPTAAALASGFLIGETRDIPADIYTLFRDTGTLHVLAVSGSNVALVIAFVLAVLWVFRPGRNRRYLLLLIAIGLFALLSYEEPSVLRASLMAALVIAARWLGRNYDLNNIISLAALIILLVAPSQLFDVGFQLSFVIAWGLILTTTRVLHRLPESIIHGRRWLYWLIMTLTVTVTAQLFAAPLMLFYFGRVPLLSPLANLLVVPMVTIGVWAMLVVLVCDFIWPSLGLLAGSMTTVWLEGIIETLRLFVTDRDTIWQVASVPWTLVLATYGLLAGAVCAVSRSRWRRGLVVAGLLALNVLLILNVVRTFQPQPQADLLLFRVPGGVAALVVDNHHRQADLIITGLYGRDYPIDERIITPTLESQGIARLRRLFVLCADYTALSDLLRLSDRHHADSVLVHPRLVPSIQDLRLQQGVNHAPCGLVAWTAAAALPAIDGYYPWLDRLLLIINGHRIAFLPDLPTPADAWPQSDLLVINARFSLPEDSVQIASLPSATTIVCARIEQQNRDEFAPSVGLPTLIDLNRAGRYRFPLDSTTGSASVPD